MRQARQDASRPRSAKGRSHRPRERSRRQSGTTPRGGGEAGGGTSYVARHPRVRTGAAEATERDVRGGDLDNESLLGRSGDAHRGSRGRRRGKGRANPWGHRPNRWNGGGTQTPRDGDGRSRSNRFRDEGGGGTNPTRERAAAFGT